MFLKTIFYFPDVNNHDAYAMYIIILHFYITNFIILISASVIYDKIIQVKKEIE